MAIQLKNTLQLCLALGVISGCGAPPPSHLDIQGAKLQRLLNDARSQDREMWFPAARELGQTAASNPGLQHRIWKDARVNTLGMRFARIDPGEFTMGPAYTHPLWPSEAHRVHLTRRFYICVTELTNEQYAELVPDHTPTRYSPHSDSPVVDLSWMEVQAYCTSLSQREGVVYRLPTEAEWEYVCRAGVSSPARFGFGDDVDKLSEYAWYGGSRDTASPVATLKPNAWGVYDMHGNVLEFVSDWFSNEGYSPSAAASVSIDPGGPSNGMTHTLRGGEWFVKDTRGCECGFRLAMPLMSIRWRPGVPRLRETIGVRIVREIVPGLDEGD